jgi:two-component system response regulator HydG
VPINVRILAATNRDLAQMVEKGTFRKDLYYRLNVVNLRIPSLRERPSDIPMLAGHFMERQNRTRGTSFTLSDDSLRAMAEYSWPGNVRELENAIERAVVLSRTDVITAADLMLDRARGSLPAQATNVAAADNAALSPAVDEADLRAKRAAALEKSGDVGLSEYLDKAAGERIARALAKARGNRAEAARSLGIGRATLYRFMRRLGNESIGEQRDNEPGE